MDHRLTRGRAVFFNIGGFRKVYVNQDDVDEMNDVQNVRVPIDGMYFQTHIGNSKGFFFV